MLSRIERINRRRSGGHRGHPASLNWKPIGWYTLLFVTFATSTYDLAAFRLSTIIMRCSSSLRHMIECFQLSNLLHRFSTSPICWYFEINLRPASYWSGALGIRISLGKSRSLRTDINKSPPADCYTGLSQDNNTEHHSIQLACKPWYYILDSKSPKIYNKGIMIIICR